MGLKRHPYLVLQDRISKLRFQEHWAMEERVKLEFEQRSFLLKCKTCKGSGRTSGEDDYGSSTTYRCSECNGNCYFYPADLELEIEKDDLRRRMKALKAKKP